MTAPKAVRTSRLQLPEPRQQAWPPPAQRSLLEPSLEQRRHPWWSAAALLAALLGVVGALLPALQGQKVGDPESAAFRIGVPLGLLGGVVAVVLGTLAASAARNSALPRGVAIVALVGGSVALFLTAALMFSG